METIHVRITASKNNNVMGLCVPKELDQILHGVLNSAVLFVHKFGRTLPVGWTPAIL
jgi:hypothetical protein